MNARRAMLPSVPSTMATMGRLLSFLDLPLSDVSVTVGLSLLGVEPVLSGGATMVVPG
jgi:hypothetical protein